MQVNEIRGGWKFASKKAQIDNEYWLTFFTSAYQRGDTIKRVYDSLINMELPAMEDGKSVKFEWLVVNDGSTDHTEELLKQWCEEDRLSIRYYYQENQGIHVAYNFAVAHCDSFAISSIDSDDALLPTALKVLYEEWQKIPDKENFKGIVGRCIDPETGKIIGSQLPYSPFDVHAMDMRYKYKIQGEMWGFNRTAVMRQYPFPTPDPRMRYCPEALVWFEMGKKYKERIVSVPMRLYYRDAANAITARSYNRSTANYFLWVYGVNNMLPYLFYSPKEVIRQYVGISMDGFRTSRSVGTILRDAKNLKRKLLVLLMMPIGWTLSKL